MKWFGKSWGAPICRASMRTPTPVGSICIMCDRAIEPDDAGFVTPYIVASDAVKTAFYHRRCLLRAVLPDELAARAERAAERIA